MFIKRDGVAAIHHWARRYAKRYQSNVRACGRESLQSMAAAARCYTQGRAQADKNQFHQKNNIECDYSKINNESPTISLNLCMNKDIYDKNQKTIKNQIYYFYQMN